MLPKSPIRTKLDEEILSALEELDNHDSTSEKYGIVVDRVSKLHKLKSEERLQLPSLDTVLIVAVNIFGILRITRYERENVITSKALGFSIKPR
ncbi:MAG: hypothetical protein ABIW84_02340 [Ilumatobacteraceae bacterium]